APALRVFERQHAVNQDAGLFGDRRYQVLVLTRKLALLRGAKLAQVKQSERAVADPERDDQERLNRLLQAEDHSQSIEVMTNPGIAMSERNRPADPKRLVQPFQIGD